MGLWKDKAQFTDAGTPGRPETQYSGRAPRESANSPAGACVTRRICAELLSGSRDASRPLVNDLRFTPVEPRDGLLATTEQPRPVLHQRWCQQRGGHGLNLRIEDGSAHGSEVHEIRPASASPGLITRVMRIARRSARTRSRVSPRSRLAGRRPSHNVWATQPISTRWTAMGGSSRMTIACVGT